MAKSREMTTVTVCKQERYSGGPFDFGSDFTPGSLDKVIESLHGIRSMIPEEYRSTAMCGIDSVSSWENSHYATISVSYKRLETDDEMRGRLLTAKHKRDEQKARDLAQLEKLRSKYPNT